MSERYNLGFAAAFMTCLLLLLSCMSCGNHKKTRHYNQDNIAWIESKLQLVFPDGTSQKHKDLLIESATIQLHGYELDNGPTRPCDVIYFDQEYLTMNNDGKQYWGIHYSPDGPIHLIMGKYYDSSALYHELCHHNHGWADVGHVDPRWESFWNPRWMEILNRIIASRRGMNLDAGCTPEQYHLEHEELCHTEQQ